MKNILTIILLLISTNVLAQEFITEEEFDVVMKQTGHTCVGTQQTYLIGLGTQPINVNFSLIGDRV